MTKDLSLAAHALAVEQVCDEIEDIEDAGGELPKDLVAKFTDVNAALSVKTDHWIGFLEALASRLDLLKGRQRRLKKAIKAGQTLQARLKDYLKYTLLQYADGEGKRLPFQGSLGKIYLQNNPPGVKITFSLEDKTVYKTIDRVAMELEPSLNAYVKPVILYTIDNDKLKSDLAAGVELPWAKLTTDVHVRIR